MHTQKTPLVPVELTCITCKFVHLHVHVLHVSSTGTIFFLSKVNNLKILAFEKFKFKGLRKKWFPISVQPSI